MIDVKKPIITRKGKPVTILTTTGPDKNFPIVGHLVGSSTMRSWNEYGVSKGKNREFDIENTTPCDPFTTEVTDGHGRVMLRLLVVPEYNEVVVKDVDCNLVYNGKEVIQKGVPIPVERLTNPIYATPATKPMVEGSLANAFYNQIKGGASGPAFVEDI